MNYFIIHSGKDYSHIIDLIELWSEKNKRAKFCVLKSTQSDWYNDAHSKIRSAHKIIYVVGETSGSNQNIDWELKTAIAENKEIYVYKLNDNYKINKVLELKLTPQIESGDLDGEFVFSQNKSNIYFVNDEILTKKFAEDNNYITDYLLAPLQENTDVALKQYEIFVETSEELVRRKQTVNSFYITINSLIVSIVLAAFAFSEKITALNMSIPIASLVVCISSLLGCIVCLSWYSLLQSYADLNSSKMKIISCIESHLAYNLFDTEWELLSQKIGNKKYKSFSNKEKFIAKLFITLYVALFVVGMVIAFL